MTDQALSEATPADGGATATPVPTPAQPVARIGLVPALTVFLSAFLLFQVQPLIGKYILPWFGGAPGVWTTCLLFFQVMLLAGYAYAHLVVSRLAPRTQAIVHAVLLLAALATLPIIPGDRWKPLDPHHPEWRIAMVLAISVGLPYFALATTAPLLQAWVTRIDPRVAPYRLYALSNVASLLALVSYPFLIEPLFTRRQQGWAWSGMFLLFAAGCAACAARASRVRREADAPGQPSNGESTLVAEPGPLAAPDLVEDDAPPPLAHRVLWIALPACASALLLGASNTLTQDVAPVPFMWVLPLALYLLTFVLAFDHPRWYSRRVCAPLMVVATAAMVWAMYQSLNDISLPQMIVIYNGGLFVACLVCHGELARVRPHPSRLTSYYLGIAAGGALGGAFVSLLAPVLFTRYIELGISLWACWGLILLIAATDRQSRLRGLRPPVLWVGLIVGFMMLGFLVWSNEPREQNTILLARMRNFFGVLRVHEEIPADPTHVRLRSLKHGRTTHGLQAVHPTLRRKPLSYYGERSGVGQAIQRLPDRPRHIGVVGLGTGALAALAREGDRVRFYEIDPNVLDVARTWFTYLADSPAQVDVVLGDARLSLEREPPQEFDLLALDAFSSDAIPVHLLTREAFAVYRRHVRKDGLFAIHISNRHLNLRPVVAGLAKAFGLRVFVISRNVKAGENGEFPSTWAIMGPSSLPSAPGETILWTDDSANLLSVMSRDAKGSDPVP